MANLQMIFPLTILIGVLLLTNSAKTIAAQYASFTTPQATNDHPLHKPTCVKLGCNKDQQNYLTSSLARNFDQKAKSSNFVDHIFKEISEGLNLRHHNAYHIARLVPTGPNPIHHR
jgi:hypothetical protein